MRISDLSSYVCSSDLLSGNDCASSCRENCSKLNAQTGGSACLQGDPSARAQRIEVSLADWTWQLKLFTHARAAGDVLYCGCGNRVRLHRQPVDIVSQQRAIAGISSTEEHTSELQSLMRQQYAVF